MNTKMNLPSENFEYHQLADGVWAAISIPTGLAASNSGIIDTGTDVVIFDTTLSPASAIELRDTAKKLTGRPVTHVLNSHMDQDHVFGNAVFPNLVKIYATTRTRELMAERTPNHISEFKKQWSGFHKEWTEAAKTATDEAERLDFEEGVRFAQKVIDAFTQLEPRLPDQTFEDQVELKGPKRTIKFMTFGGGHTDSDALLYLPEEQIIFTGDLVVIKNHPALFNGHPRKWLTILKRIKELEPIQLIPGHGELGTKADVTQVENYINELMNMAEKNWRRGGTAEDAASLPTPAFTKDWANAEAFAKNMKFLHELVQQKL